MATIYRRVAGPIEHASESIRESARREAAEHVKRIERAAMAATHADAMAMVPAFAEALRRSGEMTGGNARQRALRAAGAKAMEDHEKIKRDLAALRAAGKL